MASKSKIKSSGKIIVENGYLNRTKFSITTKLCCILGLLSFLLYANTLRNSYAMDDGIVITRNKLVGQGIQAIPVLLTTPHLKGYHDIPGDTYRPLSLVMFAVEKQFFGYEPMAGHFFNVLVYVGCVIMLFLFLDRLFEQRKTVVAFIAAFLFAIHPIHTEVVANIKSRDELLCFFFAFWSLNLLLSYAKSGKPIKLLLGALSLFLSFLSKETVITFIAVVPLIFFFYRNEARKRSLYIIVCTVAVAVLFVAIRSYVLVGINLPVMSAADFLNNQLVSVPETASRLATEILALGYYIKLLFVPWPLLCNYSYSTVPFVSLSNGWALLSFIFYAFLAVFGIYRLVKIKRDPLAFGILFFLIALSLFSNIPFLVGEIFAERFVFFASAGFCLAIALAIEKWLLSAKNTTAENKGISVLWKPMVLLVLCPLILLCGGMTIARNTDWANDYTLFTTDTKNAPGNSRLLSYAGNQLVASLKNKKLSSEEKSQIAEDAIDYLERAVAIYPGNAEAHAGMMKLFLRKKMIDSAALHAKLAIELAPDNIDILNNAAAFYFHTQQYERALALYKRNQVIDANDIGDYSNIGLCYYYLHQYDSSIANFKKASEASPENKEPYAQLAIVYNAMGQTDSASKYAEIVRQYRPNFKLP